MSKKGRLLIGDLSINVSLYQAIEQFTLGTHIFHEDCGSRINMPRRCPEHDDYETISTYNAIKIGDDEIRLNYAERQRLLRLDSSDWPVVSSLSLSKLPALVSERKLVMGGLYGVQAQNCQFGNLGSDQALLRSLVDRLRQNKQMLVVKVPILKCFRFALLIPSGTNLNAPSQLSLIPLMFTEEIRNFEIPPSSFDSRIDLALRAIPSGLPELSNEEIKSRIELWIKNRLKPAKRITIKVKDKVSR